MEYRELGNSGIKVSVICLGSMTYGEQNTADEAHEQLDYALAAGVNFIDTAEIYPSPIFAETQGDTESIIGDWIKKRKCRNDTVLAGKVSGPGLSLQWIREGKTRLDKKNITAAIDGSLRRLQTDYLDLYQTHWPDRNTNFFGAPNYSHKDKEQMTPLDETLSAMDDLVKAGKIRAFGVSNETPWGLAECLRLAKDKSFPRVQSVQNPYNLLNRSYEIGMAEISARQRCGLLAYSPLAFGVLSGKYLNDNRPPKTRLTLFGQYYKRYITDKAQAATADYIALAKKHEIDPAQMAVAFTVWQPFLTSSIIGATTMPQLKDNIAAVDIKPNEALLLELEELGKKHFCPCP